MVQSSDKVVVLDVGTDTVKAGFAGDDKPSVLIKTNEGRATAPVSGGRVMNWDEMEKVWAEAFQKLGVTAESAAGVVVTEPIFNANGKVDIVQHMFEKMNAQRIWVVNSGIAAFVASGKSTGLVVDCGHGVTQILPIYEGMPLDHAKERSTLGGAALNAVLEKQGVSGDAVQAAKELACYVSADFAGESPADETVTLPEGKQVTVPGKARTLVPEVLFQPYLAELDQQSIPESIWKAIQSSEMDTRTDLCKSILLSGGNSMFKGFQERVKAGLVQLAHEGTEINVLADAQRQNAVWAGAAMMSSTQQFVNNTMITRAEFDQLGARGAVTKKNP